jgi:putative tryptophan/tyrosine transport system substrate-binding protein
MPKCSKCQHDYRPGAKFCEECGAAHARKCSHMYRRAAYFVDRIFKGEKPADLPVEQAAKFDTVVNLRTAKVIGLTIPDWILAVADEVIE